MPLDRKLTKSALRLSAAAILFVPALYFTSIIFRTLRLYENALVSKSWMGWEGRPFQYDDELGFKLRPDTRAFLTIAEDEKKQAATDEAGFRVPLSGISASPAARTDLLFLGCSFTYGIYCDAEETFPFLVAKKTGLSYINAGVCGYSLAQMMIAAEKLIPRYKPEFVIVQYSPWLADRGIRMFSPVYSMLTGLLPTPYFTETKDGLAVAPPPFRSMIVDKDRMELRALYRGKFIKFLLKEGFGFFLYNDRHFLRTKMEILAGIRPAPAAEIDKAEQYAYDKIRSVAEKNGAKMIIVNLGGSPRSRKIFEGLPYADADSALREFLQKTGSKDFYAEFGNYNKHGVLIDGHPNAKAHRIIADSIIKLINGAARKPSIHNAARSVGKAR